MNSDDNPNAPAEEDAYARARAARNAHLAELLAMPHVVGAGIGYRKVGGQPTGEIAVVVMVDAKIPPEMLAPHEIIPHELDGVPVDIQEVGRLTAL